MLNTSNTKWNLLRRVISFVVAFAMCISYLPFINEVHAEEISWLDHVADSLSGDGTETAPYEITNGAELAKFLSDGTGYGKLKNDIDLSSYEWSPAASFSGTLDGGGHMITGLWIGSSSSRHQAPASAAYVYMGGLVNKLSGVIKNLALEVSLFIDATACTGGLYFGGLASQNTSTIDNCTITGVIDVVSPSYTLVVGGLVGELKGSIINSVNRANVQCIHSTETSNKNMRVGGLVGYTADTSTISNCVNLGDISASSMRNTGENNTVSGICGVIKKSTTINNCLNAGIITSQKNTQKKDISTGAANITTITNCYYWDSINSNYAMYGDTTATYIDHNAVMAALNANVETAGTSSGWLNWVLGNDGYPVPGKDLLPKRLSGNISITGEARIGQTLTAMLANCNEESGLSYQWRRSTPDGFEAIVNATDTTYTLTVEDIGHTLQFLVSCEGYENVLAATTAVVAKLEGPDAPSLTAVDATNATANDGKIVGTTASMEYSTDVSFDTSVDCTADETTGLAPGVYYVRVKATETVEAGAHVQIVIKDATAPELGYWTDAGNYTDAALSGSGTENDPYLITSASDLAKLAKEFNTVDSSAGKFFKITATELDLSAHEWVPITSFAGIINGNNAVIRGLWIGTEHMPRGYKNVGMFGTLCAGSVVEDLKVSATMNINHNADVNVGVIAGVISGTIDHCIVAGEINVVTTGTPSVGGVAGRVIVDSTDVQLINLGSNVEIYALGGASNAYCGGILGFVHHVPTDTTNLKTVDIVNCYNTGNVSSGLTDDNNDSTTSRRPRAGGIVGWLRGLTGDVISVAIMNCYNTGAPSINSIDGSTKGTVDGIVGAAQSAFKHFANCYCLSGVVKSSDYATVDGKVSGEQLTLANMQAQNFATELSINANLLAAEGYSNLYAWDATPDGTPIFANQKVTGTAVTLKISVDTDRLGSVKVEVNPNGEGYTEVSHLALVENGAAVKLTFVPTAGCAVQTTTVNGTPITVNDNEYTFTIVESTTIDIAFSVVSTVNVDAIYVDCEAAADGDGTQSNPYRSLEEARSKIRSVIADIPNANLIVYLMGGTYVLDETFCLGLEESSLGRLTFKSYNNEEVIITSAHAVTGSWNKVVGKNYYCTQIPQNPDGTYPAFRDLLVNGRRAQLAKSEEYTYQYNWVNAVMNGSKIASCDNLLYISAEVLSGISNENLNGVEIGQLMEWKSQIFHIAALTGESKEGELQIKLNQDEFNMLVNTDSTMKDLTGRTYWLQNHINFLDEPGEFYYDRSTGTVYYYPLSDVDMVTAEIGYATLDYLVELENAANISIDGITFTGTTANDITEHGLVTHLGNTLREPIGAGKDAGRNVPYAAIHGISNVDGITVQNCVFTELGGSAMVFDLGIKNLTVVGNVMRNLAMAGIQVGRNQRNWGENDEIGGSENVAINNNYVTNIGLVVYGAPAIRVARCVDLEIQHNTIIHVPYSGIMAGYGYFTVTDSSSDAAVKNLINADISYNYIEDFLYKINDGGAIYTSGGNAVPSNSELLNEIHHNYIRAGAHNLTYTGIYHDGSASNWHTHDNVIDDVKSTKGPMFFQDDVEAQNTHNITAENNYTSCSTITTSAVASRNIVLLNNTKVSDRIALLEIPAAKAIIDGAGLEAAYAHIAEPMDVSLQIQDATMHYSISDIQSGTTVITVKLTNYYETVKTFTLSLIADLPDFVSYEITNNGVQLEPGASAEITVEFDAESDSILTTDDVVCGFVVTEDNGRTTSFERQFTVCTKKVTGNAISFGTPTVDGYLDDAYRNSVCINLSSIITSSEPNADRIGTTSNTTAKAYLLWDEDYLYVYVIVSDTSVKTRGIEYITENYANATGNPNKLWRTDAVEAYLFSSYRGKETKFGVDAFGLQPFTNSNVAFSVVDALPYATMFTYEGQILDDYVIENPSAGQLAGTTDRHVNGYVVEMTLPLTTCMDLTSAGVPQAGDEIRFYIQINDYFDEYNNPDGTSAPVIDCLLNETQYFTLLADNTDQLAADEAKAKIEAIGTVTLDSKGDVEAAREAYDALTDDQKALVENLDVLTEAESKLAELQAAADKEASDQASADAVMEEIEAIGTVTLDSKGDVEAARAAYDALTDDQKALVENLDVLTEAESKLAELQAAADKEVADQASAYAVMEKIEAIGVVTLDSKEDIEAARVAYDALSDDQKRLVENIAMLIEAEALFRDLVNDQSGSNPDLPDSEATNDDQLRWDELFQKIYNLTGQVVETAEQAYRIILLLLSFGEVILSGIANMLP